MTASAASAQDAAPKGDTGNGKRLYNADGCFECHGHAGQGGSFLGPAPEIAHTALPFEAFQAQLRTPSNTMAAYAKEVMTDQELADIYAYVESLPGPRDAKDIPEILKH